LERLSDDESIAVRESALDELEKRKLARQMGLL